MNFIKSVLGGGCKIEIELDNASERQQVDVTTQDGKTEKFPLFIGDEIVKGKVKIELENNAKKKSCWNKSTTRWNH